jgi:hypothetical protein
MKVKDLIAKLSSVDPELEVGYEKGHGIYKVCKVSSASAFKGVKSGTLYSYSNEDRQEEKVKFILLIGEY